MSPPTDNQHHSDVATATSVQGYGVPIQADWVKARNRGLNSQPGTESTMNTIKRILRMWYL